MAAVEPVRPAVGHVVAGEWQHRERVAAQLADRPLGRGCLLGGDGGAEEDAVVPVDCLGDQGNVRGTAATEDDRVDRYAGRVVPVLCNGRALFGGDGEARVRV